MLSKVLLYNRKGDTLKTLEHMDRFVTKVRKRGAPPLLSAEVIPEAETTLLWSFAARVHFVRVDCSATAENEQCLPVDYFK